MKKLTIPIIALLLLCSGCGDTPNWLYLQKEKKMHGLEDECGIRFLDAGVSNVSIVGLMGEYWISQPSFDVVIGFSAGILDQHLRNLPLESK